MGRSFCMNRKLKNILFTMGVILTLCSADVHANSTSINIYTPPVISLYPSESSFCHALDVKPVVLEEDPFIQNNRLFVPLRELCNKTGCDVSWNESTYQAKVTRGFKSVIFTIGENSILVNNVEKSIDVAPQLIDGKTFVPIRALVESLGDEVTWNLCNNTPLIGIIEKDKSYLTGSWNSVVSLTKTDVSTSPDGSFGRIKVCVPQILNTNATVSIDKINEYYREKGRNEFKSYKKMYAKDIANVYSKELSYEMSYSIGYNANDILSVQRLVHLNRDGINPSYEFCCDVFDINTAQKLSIDDILNGSTSEIQEFLINKFSKMIDENNYNGLEEQMKNLIKENIGKVQFYLDGDDLVFLFNPYVVGPRCVGTPRIKINIKENSLMFKRKFIDKTNYEEEIKILNTCRDYYANPQIIDKTTLNNIECYVIQCNDNFVAIDRNCENIYKLTKHDDLYKIFYIQRVGEINNLSALRLVMNKMNSDDLCYDVGGTLYDDNGEYIIVAMQSLDEDVTSKLAVHKRTGEIFSYYFEEQIPEKIDSFKDEYCFLGNFYEAPVMYNGLAYRSNEAAFQAQKCKNVKDMEKFTTMDPEEAQKAGQSVELREDWGNVKLSIMKDIVRAKFLQNADLAKKLLATKTALLEEENTWSDTFWGTVDGQGENHLGKILMEVREELLKTRKAA